MVEEPVLVLFCGGMTGSAVEAALGEALRECALDTLEDALSTGGFAEAIVVADAASAAYFEGHLPTGVRLDVDVPGEAFHFGRRLTGVVQRYRLMRPVYAGSGLPLIKGDELAAVANALRTAERVVVSNNFFSADLVGFVPGSVASELELPDNDRILPRLLNQKAGLENRALPRTMYNQFDLDTPGDLAILACAGGAGRHISRYIEAHPPRTQHLVRAARYFTDRDAEVLVAGRVGSSVWQFLETETACRIRMFSEERGLQAAGREASGEARSLLAFHLQAVGTQRFFADLGELAQAAFLDTRPIFAHLGLLPSRPDRFLSDSLEPEGIADAWLRDFTAAAREAPIPVVLGSSTLVASGVQLLSEAAWREKDRASGETYQAYGRAATP
jgi:hypothetical protein